MKDNEKEKIVEISHGGGGKRMDDLIHFLLENIDPDYDEELIIGPQLGDDSGIVQFDFPQERIVVTTDSHTVDPIFFKGGDIGDLAISGTINDLVVMGAVPKYLTLGLIIEEGYKFSDLKKITNTIGELLKKTGVMIVAGDTKVMPAGMLSNLVVNTAGIGLLPNERDEPFADSRAEIGDVIIVTGPIGDHGTSLMSLREGIELETELESDVDPFWPAFNEIIRHPGVKVMKDLTRGGLASALNDIASSSNVCLEINEPDIPINDEAQAIADMLGLEILEISCEGKAVVVVDKQYAKEILEMFKDQQVSKFAVNIGEVKSDPVGRVHIITEIGGTRILDKPYGEPIPRVC